MSKKTNRSLTKFLGGAAIVLAASTTLMAMAAPEISRENSGLSTSAIVQNDYNSGSWTLEPHRKSGSNKVHISFKREGRKHGYSHMGRSYDPSDLNGLSLSGSGRRDVAFTIESDAGAVKAEGIMR